MKKLLTVLLILSFLLALLIPASAAEQDSRRVFDKGNLLTQAEVARITASAEQAKEQADCDFYIVTYSLTPSQSSYEYRYTGEMFLSEYGRRSSENIVILVVTWDKGQYFYNYYTYGNAMRNISQKEVDYILDHEDVYDAIKGGRVTDGCCAVLGLSAQAYNGRLGVSYWIIAAVAAVIALIVGLFVCLGVWNAYKLKHASVDYPLNHYAQLELTEKKDEFAGTFITKRIIQSGGNGMGGGGSAHGGGAGHRGGR